jgi:hypothetical protein
MSDSRPPRLSVALLWMVVVFLGIVAVFMVLR